jgi:amidase
MLSTAAMVQPPYQERIRHALEIRDRSLSAEALLSPPPPSDLLDVTDVPRSSGVLSEWELAITEEHDASALVDLLVSRKVSAVALLEAFRKRATVAQQLVYHAVSF